MKTILLMDIVIVFVGIYLAVSAAKMKKSGQISDLVVPKEEIKKCKASGVDNYSYGSADNLHFDDHDFSADVIKMDIRDKEGMKALFEQEKFDIVYNIAGIAPLPDCQSDPVEAVSVNTLGLVNVLENARRTGVKHVIQASTNAMYENETEFPTVESKFNPPTLIYPNTKYCGERFCQSFADTYGMNITCLRFANVYGPHIDCLRKQPPFVGYMSYLLD